jgi:preprotein translocase subunit SecD
VVYRLGPVVITGTDVASADAVTHLANAEPAWFIHIVLTTSGKARFEEATTAMVGGQLAIVVDGAVMSAPTVQVPITEGVLEISGDFTKEEAGRMASSISASGA